MLWLVKRRYMGQDLMDSHYGRYFEIPARLATGGRVAVFCLDYANRPHRVETPVPNLTIESFPLRRIASMLMRARRLARSHPAPIVIGGSDSPYALFARHVARSAQAGRFVCDLYDDYDTFASARLPLMRRWFRRTVRHADALVFFEDLFARQWEAAGYTRTHVVPNGIDDRVFRPLDRQQCRAKHGLPQDARIVGHLGAVWRTKNVADIFDAVARLHREDPRVMLLLAGTVERGMDLPQDGVRHIGQVSHAQVPDLIGACDVLTAAVRYDEAGDISFPIKVMEYIACHRPFLTPARGGAARHLASYPEYLYTIGDAAGLADKLQPWLAGATPRFPPVVTWDDAASAYAQALDWPAPVPQEARANQIT